MVKKYLTIFILIVSLFFVLPQTASAVEWFPIVPCGLNNQPDNVDRMDTLPDGTQVPHDYTQPCNKCLLIELGKNVIDFTFFGIVPSVGTLMFLIAGFIILFNARSGNSSGVNKGRQIMKDTAIGIAIILGAWLITNFILRSLANDQIAQTPWYQIQCTVGTLKDAVEGTVPPPVSAGPKFSCNSSNTCALDPNGKYTSNTCGGDCPAPTGGVLAITTASLTDAVQGTAYSKTLSASGGTAPYTWSLSSGTLPAGVSISGAVISGTPTATGTSTFTVKVEDSASPKQSTTKGLTIKVNQTAAGVQCLQSGLNLCQGVAPTGGSCANSRCAQYASMIQNQASGAATVNVLKAFMEIESSCDIGAATGTSYGLMQLTPPIPQIYGTRCGIPQSEVAGINRAWLTNPINAEKSICISVQWINSVAASQCGSSIRNLYAGYNGGQNGACAPSVSCAGETSCSGEPVKRWECLYEDKAKTVCNGGNGPNACLIPTSPGQKCGYNQTRQGATKIMYCATNPGF